MGFIPARKGFNADKFYQFRNQYLSTHLSLFKSKIEDLAFKPLSEIAKPRTSCMKLHEIRCHFQEVSHRRVRGERRDYF